MPGFVGHVHLDEDVARKCQLRRDDFLAALRFHNVFRRDENLTDALAEVISLDAVHQAFGNFALVSRIGVNDVPLLF